MMCISERGSDWDGSVESPREYLIRRAQDVGRYTAVDLEALRLVLANADQQVKALPLTQTGEEPRMKMDTELATAGEMIKFYTETADRARALIEKYGYQHKGTYTLEPTYDEHRKHLRKLIKRCNMAMDALVLDYGG